MRYFLAAAVLATSLSFVATAALANDPHEGPAFNPAADQQMVVTQADSMTPVVAGGSPDQQVWSGREERGDTR